MPVFLVEPFNEPVPEAPGTAVLIPCADHGTEYCDCGGSGYWVLHACIRPQCADTGLWEYTSYGAMCYRCGLSWTLEDPHWLAQRIPDSLRAATPAA